MENDLGYNFFHGFHFMFQVLEENELSCTELLSVKTDGIILTKQSKEIYFLCLIICLGCCKEPSQPFLAIQLNISQD